MELKTAKATPINQEGRFLILLFGPDKDLKRIAQHARARFAGYTVNIRSTDNPADAYAEFTPCDKRIIIDSANGQRVAQLYDAAGLTYSLMRWDGEALHSDLGGASDRPVGAADADSALGISARKPRPPALTLSDGREVERDYALERAARHMGMSVAALSSLDDATLSGAVEVALGKAEPPQAMKRRKRKADSGLADADTEEHA